MDKPPFLYHFVPGVPAPQGSKSFKGMHRSKKSGKQIAIMVESSKKVAPWRDAVAAGLLDERGKPRAVFGDGAVRLTIEFVMPRTGAEPKGWTRHHTRAPDIDKCVRSTCDAISTAGVWGDDKLVVELLAVKRTAEPGEPTGALIMIEKLPEKEKPHGKAQTGKRSIAGRADGRGSARRGRGGASGDGQPSQSALALV